MRRECPEWDMPPEWVTVERIGDLLDTDPAIQAILSSQAGVPGDAPANVGVIGEVVTLSGQISIPAFNLSQPYDTIMSLTPALPAGDWMLWSSAFWQRSYPGVYFRIISPPPGITTNLAGGFWGGTGPTSTIATGLAAHALRSSSVGLVFDVHVNPGAGVFAIGNFALTVTAQRIR